MDHTNLPDKFIHTLELIEAEGNADLFASAPIDWKCKVVQIGGAYVFIMPQYDNMIVNKVVGLGLTEPVTEEMIDEMLALYRDAGIHNFAFQICPAANPPLISDWLAVRGIDPIYNWVKIFRRADQDITAATDLRIEKIGAGHSKEYSNIFCEVFELPDDLRPWIASSVGRSRWRHYLAFDGDIPVATGALFVNEHVGALLGATTLASHRRRGAQSALMAKRIEDAREMGCEWIVTETWEEQADHPNPSYHNMLRAGFQLAYRRPNFMMRD